MQKKLRIAINAQIKSGSGTGGIETVLRVLTALNRLDGNEEYVFIGHWSDSDWLESLLGERQTLIRAKRPAVAPPNRAERLKRALGALRPIVRAAKNLIAPASKANFSVPVSVPVSQGFYENLNCAVIHFPYQDFVSSRVPSVYNPHDLQHLHFPQFFAHEEIERREIIYPAACRAAETVVVASQFVKQDVAQKYLVEPHKIQVIPWSPPAVEANGFTETDARRLLERYDCPPRPFVLYPAMTWEHKNHLRLLEAVALLRERENLKINVVCTGHKNAFYPEIERRLHELKLESQVKFTGVVEYRELGIFYGLAQFVIVPTLFEAASAPVFEAWQHRVAVACANVTSLPEQTSGAAFLFDPLSVEAIADALKTLASDENLRADLRRRGVERLKDFNEERTLKAYRAVYRKTAGISLNDEDRYLLAWDWARKF